VKKILLFILLCIGGAIAFYFYNKNNERTVLEEEQKQIEMLIEQERSQPSLEEKTQQIIAAYKAATEKFNAIQDQASADQQADAVVSEITNIAIMDLKMRSDNRVEEHEKNASFREQAPYSQLYRDAAKRLFPFYQNNAEALDMLKAASP